MTVAGVVMAHEKRRKWAEELAERLAVDVVWDKVNDRHETGLRCLQAGLGSDASHWVIVQDDAIVCRDLLDGLAKATEFSGDRIVGLYFGNTGTQNGVNGRKFTAARKTGVSWVEMPGPLWGVGVVVPTVHLPDLIAHYAKSRYENYDRRIEKWAAAAKVTCWYTIPSLVEHRHGEENPSIIGDGRKSTTRRSLWFVGGDASALDVDWSRTPVASTGMWRRVGTNRVVRVAPGSSQEARYARSDQWTMVAEGRCCECGARRYTEVG